MFFREVSYSRFCLGLILQLIFALPVFAVNASYVPLGEREALMSNTGTGIGGTGASVYYNPGGLALVDGSRLSFQGSGYFIANQTTKNDLTLDGVSADKSETHFIALPHTAISVFKVGEYTAATGLLIPVQMHWISSDSIRSATNKLATSTSNDVSELWITGALARKFGVQWSVGASAYVIRNQTNSLGISEQSNLAGTDKVTTSSSVFESDT